LNVTGKVTQVQQDLISFALNVWTPIPQGAANTHLNIQVFISPKTGWIFPEQRHPCPNSIINFTGNLITMLEGVVIVSLDKLTYLPHLGREGDTAPPALFPAIQLQPDDL
jgi:hypothetical protein